MGCSFIRGFLFVLFWYSFLAISAEIPFKRLVELIETKNISSPDEFLSATFNPNGLNDVTLLYESRGLAKEITTGFFPRIVTHQLIDGGGRVVSLSGNPAEEDFSKMEVLECSKRFENPCNLALLTFEPQGGKSFTIRTNPPECISCHGVGQRPLWDQSHWIWPGIYGSLAGQTIQGSSEEKMLEEFLKRIEGTRYQRVSEYRGFPRPRQIMTEMEFNKILDNPKEWWKWKMTPRLMESFVTALGFPRILHELKRSPDYQRFKFALLAALIPCPQLEGFLPKKIADTFRIPYTAIANQTSGYFGSYEHELKIRFLQTQTFFVPKPVSPSIWDPEAYVTKAVAGLRYLFENRAMDISELSLDSQSKYFRFLVAGSPLREQGFVGYFWNEESLFDPDPDFAAIQRKYPGLEPTGSSETFCRELKNRSLNALN